MIIKKDSILIIPIAQQPRIEAITAVRHVYSVTVAPNMAKDGKLKRY